ncbi:hypothetical protein MHYP_G00083290 [Metynnis hypsauchen]
MRSVFPSEKPLRAFPFIVLYMLGAAFVTRLSGSVSALCHISGELCSALESQVVRGRQGTQCLPLCLIIWALELFLPG